MNAPVLALFAVTDTEGVAHLVTENAMVAGRSAGRYLAVCDTQILAASLTTPEHGYCRLCRRWRAGR